MPGAVQAQLFQAEEPGGNPWTPNTRFTRTGTASPLVPRFWRDRHNAERVQGSAELSGHE